MYIQDIHIMLFHIILSSKLNESYEILRNDHVVGTQVAVGMISGLSNTRTRCRRARTSQRRCLPTVSTAFPHSFAAQPPLRDRDRQHHILAFNSQCLAGARPEITFSTSLNDKSFHLKPHLCRTLPPQAQSMLKRSAADHLHGPFHITFPFHMDLFLANN
ncbi:hypothetical protein NQ318_010635 [Aromia moschata]|uniref:Uncharacterized protein n=1 Tax=Aromia moschata TaxID=1265417 RepID=A0AAV8X9W8_9CUCU|nr:hypothetical protein NQ318_010635 [Aromia moschata]